MIILYVSQKCISNVLRIHNPGIMALLKWSRIASSENLHFQRFFLSFPAQKAVFVRKYKPFIGLDGFHFRGKFGGVMLIIV